ncbi:Alpha/beta hydrolase family protein [Tritonibacter multivorans]|uniref:Alpha/beta hydrolase family protein n=1 Tax=Tritonibacter multivorans TaxID=928856 RepID=A0A0N7M005_9RHOB|nr:alpha/beta hydrolase [Tritonibacter multivorans]MDA7422902.1 alpha/beta hydrolase [Tritonibacter multivorans]CUH79121.1 Alpha/beta hydrolase family protein [Tritonibacter multivorans]SFD78378.1 Alpha/beta hydrolase family protein [Tritonibacter multivorans]
MTDASGIDWEDAFANAAYIPDGMSYLEKWRSAAAAFRQTAMGELDIPYGTHPREVFDLFTPDTTPKGLAVFVHGGYWLDFDKSSWSHLAQGALAHGWAVALPSYVLAPEATLPDITRQVAQAISRAAQRVAGPIHLAGHSAGGHLVTRMACQNAPLPPEIAARISRVVSISGLHDLRPLMLHSMNTNLQLSEESAAVESTALQPPRAGIETIAWVGAAERPEFLRQSSLLVENWGRQGADTRLVADPQRHHFDVVDGLTAADHPLCQAFVGE